MKNSKAAMFVAFVLLALPIPFSFISGFLSIVVFLMSERPIALDIWLFIICLFLASLYLVSYLIALICTIKKKAFAPISFLPLMHIGFVVASYYIIWFLSPTLS